MVKIFFFLVGCSFFLFDNISFANNNVTLNTIASELQQLRDAFHKMEEDYKAKIENLEEQLAGQKTEKELNATIREVERDYKTRIRTVEELLGNQKTEMEQDYGAKIRTLEELLEEERTRSQEEYTRITQRAGTETRPFFYGTKGSLMNPDVSIIGDTFYHFSDSKFGVGEFTDEDLYLREVELAIQGYIYPGVRAEFYPVWEVEEGKVGIEEAFANFLTLPFNSNLLVGRHRIRFGLVNPIHQHYRDYVDVPLAVQNLLGAEGYTDDGINFSVMVPKISIPVELGFGIFDGDKPLAEEEKEEEEGIRTSQIFESEPVEFSDHVFLAKINTNLLILSNFDISMGYHVLWDGNSSGNTAIHNGQFSLRYRFLNSWSKLLWQNELYVADDDNRDITSKGFYSFINYTYNKFFDAGFRYDWSELGTNDDSHIWALNPIFTWHLTESSYVRAQYRYGELESSISGNSSVNEGFIQFVWGLGPHAHSLEQ
ncbi:MAG: DUF3435 domain-containing protein [Candidatus Scalindua sp.]|nr:DUF3435 domain-containing protein [Candidatus Scalindua sp.]